MQTIYKITNLLNGMIYIGVHKTNNPYDSYYGSGKHIIKAISEYGKNNFKKEIIFVCEDHEKELAYFIEEEIVDRIFVLREDTYNKSIGGQHGPIMYGKHNPWYGKKHTIETLKKIFETKKANGKLIVSKERKIQISEQFKLMWTDPIKRKQIIDSRTGLKRTDDFKAKCKNWMTNRKVSEETRQKLSNTLKGKVQPQFITPEAIEKRSEKRRGMKCDWVAEKINRNPEKIRKTAEKHRGMKRSEETCKNISEAKKGKEGYFKDKFCCHNPDTLERIWLTDGEDIPDKFILGTGLKRKSRKAKTLIMDTTNSEECFECGDGNRFRSIRQHLKKVHNMSMKEFKLKYSEKYEKKSSIL